jgi:hypothetical protein
MPIKDERGARNSAPPIEFTNRNRSNHSTQVFRTQRLAERVHRLGARALHELMLELSDAYGSGVVDRFEQYARIDVDLLRALGGDRFPPSPIRGLS